MVDMVRCKGSTTSSAVSIVDVSCKRLKVGQSGSHWVGQFKKPLASNTFYFWSNSRNDRVESMHRILENVLGGVALCQSMWHWTRVSRTSNFVNKTSLYSCSSNFISTQSTPP